MNITQFRFRQQKKEIQIVNSKINENENITFDPNYNQTLFYIDFAFSNTIIQFLHYPKEIKSY